MAEINDLEVVDDNNTARFPEGQAPSTVNNGARGLEGIIARWHKDTNGSLSSTGSADAYVVAANQTLSAYYDGLIIMFKANFDNAGPATLNVDGIGAADILRNDGLPITIGDIVTGQRVQVAYDGSDWIMMSAAASANQIPTGTPLPYFGATAPAGYVLGESGTIGSGASGGTARANEDTRRLYYLFWNDWADTEAPVTGGRGASAQADFDADKTLTLPDLRGRMFINIGIGPENIEGGNPGTERIIGTYGGTEEHVQLEAELAAHSHGMDRDNAFGGGFAGAVTEGGNDRQTSTVGSSTAMDWMPPWLAGNYIIKL